MPFPNLNWLGVLGVLFGDELAIDCILKIHYIDNGLDHLLSNEPNIYRSGGAGILVAVLVIQIWDQILYMCGLVCHQDNHAGKIN